MNEIDEPSAAAVSPACEPEVILVPVARRPAPRWAKGFWLLAASVVGSILVVPYSLSLEEQSLSPMELPEGMMPVLAAVEIVFEGVIAAAAIAIGLGLGRRTGLDGPLLSGLEGTTYNRRRALRAIAVATVWGVILAAVLIGLDLVFAPLLPKAASALHEPPAWTGFFASFGAGIREEVWLRLGCLTFLVWLGIAATRRATAGPLTFWTANALAALMFGAMHLPQASDLIGLTGPVVALVLIGNGVPGLVWGWLYRRDGLVAAMISHTVLDLLLKCLVPLLSG